MYILWLILAVSAVMIATHAGVYAIRWMEIINSDSVTDHDIFKTIHITWRSFYYFCRESVCGFIFEASLPLFFLSEKRFGGHHDSESLPVIFAHGYSQNSSNFIVMMRRFKRNGFHNLFTIDYKKKYYSIESLAKQLSAKVDMVREITGQDKVILIGHSMGGIVSRYYAQKLEGAEKVAGIITIGTPHHGTRLTGILPGRCAREMMLNSKLLLDLNSDEVVLPRLPLTSLYSYFDAAVVPYWSAKAPKGLPSVEFRNWGHTGLLYAREVTDRAIEIVRDMNSRASH